MTIFHFTEWIKKLESKSECMLMFKHVASLSALFIVYIMLRRGGDSAPLLDSVNTCIKDHLTPTRHIFILLVKITVIQFMKGLLHLKLGA